MGKNVSPIFLLVQDKIFFLVTEDDLCEAIKYLFELVKIYQKNRLSEVTVLARGISDLKKECLLGKIGFKEASEIKNQLADRLLGITLSISPDNDLPP